MLYLKKLLRGCRSRKSCTSIIHMARTCLGFLWYGHFTVSIHSYVYPLKQQCFFIRSEIGASPSKMKSMALCKTVVTPMLTHWGYCTPVISHWCELLPSPWYISLIPIIQKRKKTWSGDVGYSRKVQDLNIYIFSRCTPLRITYQLVIHFESIVGVKNTHIYIYIHVRWLAPNVYKYIYIYCTS